MVKEIEALLGRDTLKYIDSTAKKMKEDGYSWASLRMLFVVKQDGQRKARLIIGGHVLDSENMDCYASVMKSISQRLLMIIASANNFGVLTGDIKNAYFYADCDVKMYTRVGEEFEIAGYSSLPKGSLATVIGALYGVPSSGMKVVLSSGRI